MEYHGGGISCNLLLLLTLTLSAIIALATVSSHQRRASGLWDWVSLTTHSLSRCPRRFYVLNLIWAYSSIPFLINMVLIHTSYDAQPATGHDFPTKQFVKLRNLKQKRPTPKHLKQNI